MVPSSVSPPPPMGWVPGSTPHFPSICKLLAAFLRSSFVFARSLQHFWLPASHLLGTCYLLGDLRSTHTPSKYLRATYRHIYIYVLCIYFLFTTCVLWQHYMCLTYTVQYLPYIPMMPCIPYLSYIPHVLYIWNITTTPSIHTIPNIHAIHTIPTLHRKHSLPIIATIHTIQTIHTVISNIPCPTYLHTIPTIHTIPTNHAIPCLPYIPNIPYFPNMPYQTDHTHHSYSTYHTTPPPHHRGEGGVAGPGAYIYIYGI